jgi:hypothetical protein
MRYFHLCVQIGQKVAEVRAMRERLQRTWEDRKNFYEQIFDLQIFLRDTEQLNTISASQEVSNNAFISCYV